MRKSNKVAKVVAPVAVAVAPVVSKATTIKVRTVGPRGGQKFVNLEPISLKKFKNGNRQAVVALGKRGGKVTVYASKGDRSFAPKAKQTA
jgi:hypothetical protein